MKTLSDHPLIRTWRITERELCDGEFIDLLGPGYIQFDPGDIRFHLSDESSFTARR